MIELCGLRLRVGVKPGSGVPLLIFNGIGASIELLAPFVDRLHRHIIVFDAPGAGESQRTELPFRPRYLAELANSLLDELGVSKVDVLGVSWGGVLAQQFCRQYSSRTRRMVLCATSTGHAMIPGRPDVLMHMIHPRRYLNRKYFSRVVGKIYGGSLRADKEAALSYARMMRPPTMAGYYYQMLAVLGWTSLHWLHRIKQPTLVLAGRDDPIVPLINGWLLANMLPNGSLKVVDCGHLFLLTQAEQTAPYIDRFLESN